MDRIAQGAAVGRGYLFQFEETKKLGAPLREWGEVGGKWGMGGMGKGDGGRGMGEGRREKGDGGGG